MKKSVARVVIKSTHRGGYDGTEMQDMRDSIARDTPSHKVFASSLRAAKHSYEVEWQQCSTLFVFVKALAR